MLLQKILRGELQDKKSRAGHFQNGGNATCILIGRLVLACASATLAHFLILAADDKLYLHLSLISKSVYFLLKVYY
jgi:hypothetical protein